VLLETSSQGQLESLLLLLPLLAPLHAGEVCLGGLLLGHGRQHTLSLPPAVLPCDSR
jgi:hypothetical protein